MSDDGMKPVEPMRDLHWVAQQLGINERTVWRRIAQRVLRKPLREGRSARWFESDIAQYQQRLRDERGE